MQLQTASRKQAKIKIGLQGPSGAGKSYSALLLAYGLCGDWTKVAVIDTENNSAALYDHLGPFQVLPLGMPFTPERYIEAILACEKAGIAVIIIDSISHEWDANGGILSVHSSMTGNSYLNWNKLSPRHSSFVQYILQSPTHTISTIRSKTEYILSEKNGKQVPEKVGMKGITREGMDYEFTIVFELNMANAATATKDRTSLFFKKAPFVITPEIGKTIAEWCNDPKSNLPETSKIDVLDRLNACKSLGELLSLYNSIPSLRGELVQDFTKKRQELTPAQPDLQLQNFSTNGSSKIK